MPTTRLKARLNAGSDWEDPTTGVEEALGRPATDFSEYLRKVMAAGAWHRSGLVQQA